MKGEEKSVSPTCWTCIHGLKHDENNPAEGITCRALPPKAAPVKRLNATSGIRGPDGKVAAHDGYDLGSVSLFPIVEPEWFCSLHQDNAQLVLATLWRRLKGLFFTKESK